MLVRFVILSMCLAAAPVVASPEPMSATLVVDADQPLRDVPPLIFGHNVEWVYGGQSLFNKDGSGAVPGLVDMLRPLRPALIRYPGGSLSNTFRFADSIGAMADRKPVANFFTLRGDFRKQMTYKTEVPTFGFNECAGFAADLGSPGVMVTVNCTWWPANPELSGTAQEAAAWVAYTNSALDQSPVPIGVDRRGIDWHDSQHWARLRRSHGREQPWNVSHWEVGNEVYAPGQGAGMTGKDYATVLAEFTAAMKKVDPGIKIGAVVEAERPDWNRPVIEAASACGADFLIFHKYGPGAVGRKLFVLAPTTPIAISVETAGKYTLVLEASGQPAQNVYPQMSLALNDKELGEFTVEANTDRGKRQAFRFTQELSAGTHVLTVRFLNDFYQPPEDRNLILEGLYLEQEDGPRRALSLLSPEQVMAYMAGHVDLLDRHLAPIRKLTAATVRPLPLHITEYNAMFGLSQAELQSSRDLKSALYTAAHVQKFLHAGDVEGANFWCIRSAGFVVVEPGPQGWRLSPAGLVFAAMSPPAQGKVVHTKWTSVTPFTVPLASRKGSWVSAAAVRDKRHLAIGLVAWHPERPTRLQLHLAGVKAAGQRATVNVITGPDIDAINPDGKPAVIQSNTTFVEAAQLLELLLPPASVTTVVIPIP